MPAMNAEITPSTLIEPIYEEQIVERFLEIRDSRGHQLVSTIELLSPSNKMPSAKGFETFPSKTGEVVQIKCSLARNRFIAARTKAK